MREILLVTVVLAASAGGTQLAYAEESMPWVVDAPDADGYSVKLEAINPAPGTPLVRGSEVTVTVSISYTMTIAPHGFIALVLQDEENRPIIAGPPQAKIEVSSASGAATLTQTLVIPCCAKELRVFVPLVPDGLADATGVDAIRYPVVEKK